MQPRGPASVANSAVSTLQAAGMVSFLWGRYGAQRKARMMAELRVAALLQAKLNLQEGRTSNPVPLGGLRSRGLKYDPGSGIWLPVASAAASPRSVARARPAGAQPTELGFPSQSVATLQQQGVSPVRYPAPHLPLLLLVLRPLTPTQRTSHP